MSATDNILAGIGGALEGFKDVYVPYQQTKFKYGLERQMQQEKLAQEFEQQKKLKAYESDLELNQKRALMPDELSAKLKLEQEKQKAPMAFVDGDGNVVGYGPRGSKQLTTNKGPNAGQQAKIDAVQKEIDELGSVDKSLGVLNSLHGQANPGLASGIASGAQKLPLFPDSFAPQATNYNGLRKELKPQLALALTGSKQGLIGMGKLTGEGIPELNMNTKESEPRWDELRRQLYEKKLDAYKRKASLGGALTDEETSDAAKMQKFIQGLGGQSGPGGQYGSAEEVRSAFQAGKIDRATAKNLLSQF